LETVVVTRAGIINEGKHCAICSKDFTGTVIPIKLTYDNTVTKKLFVLDLCLPCADILKYLTSTYEYNDPEYVNKLVKSEVQS
jgi:hypothetical protein